MIATTKSIVALSALLSAGIVAAIGMVGTRADSQSATTPVTQRFPVTSEMFVPVSMAYFTAHKFAGQPPVADGSKSDKLMAISDTCAQKDWAYLSQDCLVPAEGKTVRKVSRVITIERRVGENTSELVRVPVADLAQR
jgi:hypothetical protein